MAEQTVEVGNTIILVIGINDPFSDGHTTGYLEFYDERHRPTFPLTTHTIHDYLERAIHAFSLESGTYRRLDGSPYGKFPANLQKFSSGGSGNSLARGVKEEAY